MEYGLGEYAVIFKAMSDETRLKILLMLTKGKTCACKILEEFHFTQPTLSYHVKLLTDCGLVDAEKEGRWVYYSINEKRAEVLIDFISRIRKTCDATSCCNGEC